VDRLQAEYADRIEFRLYDVDAGQGAEFAERFGVQVVPTFVFVNADGTVSDQRVGALTEQRLRSALAALR